MIDTTLTNKIREGEIDINNQSLFFSAIIKGLLNKLYKDLKIRDIYIPHFILNTGDDTMYLQVDLGGTMMMLDADVNAFTIKTPSTLSHSQLRLSGNGNTVKEIIVLEGNKVNDKIEYLADLNTDLTNLKISNQIS